MRLSPRELVFIGLLFLLPVLMWAMVFQPRKDTREVFITGLETQQRKIRGLDQNFFSAEKNLLQDIDLLQKAIGGLQKHLPGEEQTHAEVIAELAKLSSRCFPREKHERGGVNVVRPKKTAAAEEDSGDYFTKDYSVELEGGFLEFLTFLRAMEDQPRIINVESFRIKRLVNVTAPKVGEKPVPDGQIRVTLELKFCCQRRKGDSPDAP